MTEAWQICPKCQGQGKVQKPSWVAGDQHEWTSNTAGPHTCNLCNGKMIISTLTGLPPMDKPESRPREETTTIASELRLGNWVTINNGASWPEYKGVPLRVTGVELCSYRDFQVSTGAVHLKSTDNPPKTFCQFDEFISPIPLTEEWLLNKCGAIKAPDKFGGLLLPPKSIRILKDENGFYHLTGSPFGQEIRLPFVHKLQNFIYEYTGTELTIKE